MSTAASLHVKVAVPSCALCGKTSEDLAHAWAHGPPHPGIALEPSPKLLRCSRCREAYYCNVDHQRKHWKIHKNCARRVAAEADAAAAASANRASLTINSDDEVMSLDGEDLNIMVDDSLLHDRRRAPRAAASLL
jgi:hypothetical protein